MNNFILPQQFRSTSLEIVAAYVNRCARGISRAHVQSLTGWPPSLATRFICSLLPEKYPAGPQHDRWNGAEPQPNAGRILGAHSPERRAKIAESVRRARALRRLESAA